MQVFVTGADGFLGRYLCQALADRGHTVDGLVRSVEAAKDLPFVRPWEADIADADAIGKILKGVRPMLIVHLAAISNVAHGDIEEMYRTNIIGSRNILQGLVDAGVTPDAIMLASSGNIYGRDASGVVGEDAPSVPANDYGVTKVAMENLAGLYYDRLPIIVVRPFNYTGVGQSSQFIVPKLVNHIVLREPTIELGNLDVARDFSDVRDTCESYIRLLETPEAVGRTVNVSSGKAHSLRELIHIAERLSGHRLDVKVNPAFVRENEVPYLCGSRQLLESLIGAFQPRTIEETVQWMMESHASYPRH